MATHKGETPRGPHILDRDRTIGSGRGRKGTLRYTVEDGTLKEAQMRFAEAFRLMGGTSDGTGIFDLIKAQLDEAGLNPGHAARVMREVFGGTYNEGELKASSAYATGIYADTLDKLIEVLKAAEALTGEERAAIKRDFHDNCTPTRTGAEPAKDFSRKTEAAYVANALIEKLKSTPNRPIQPAGAHL